MIAIKQLTKSFGRTRVLDGLSFDVAAGESVALWGANGAGKTTIIRCIAGLYQYQGAIHVDGLCARHDGKRVRQLTGYVPQESGIYDEQRVASTVHFFASLRGVRIQNVNDALASVGLALHAHKRVRQLSGGMKQRLSLAVALLGNPQVLLLDEVTASLDALGRNELIGLLSTIARDNARSVLFASHRVEEIAALATRVLVLREGRIQHDLPVAEFVGRYSEMLLLHLLMDHSQAVRAIDVLSRCGVTGARLNGRGILVPVKHGNRMMPVRVIHEAGLSIEDFEVLSGDTYGGDV
jgi:ABC-type multidrug transport system ATPase subunit